ncbi:MAG: hypothetical protein V1904_10890 [Bacteroidota bacterium]
MKTTVIFLFAAMILLCAFSCSSSSSGSHNVTSISYDTIHREEGSCTLLRLFFTTGFDNNKLTVNWNNAIIYNGTLTTDKVKGLALRSVTLPKNQCRLEVTIDDISLETEPGTDYCNMMFRKSNDSLFLEYTNKKPEFD